jgi:hypothetical protein
LARYRIDELAAQNDASPAEVRKLIQRLGLRHVNVAGGETYYGPRVAGELALAFQQVRRWHQQAGEKQKTGANQ